MKISFERRFLFIFLLIALAAISVGIVAYRNNKSIANSNFLVSHTHQVLYRTEKTLSGLKDMETGIRGYIITHDPSFLDPYYQAKDSILPNIKKLAALTEDNVYQQLHIDTLNNLVAIRISQCTAIVKLRPDELGNNDNLLNVVREGKSVMDKIRRTIKLIETEENRLLKLREDANDENYRQIKTKFLILFGVVFFIFGVAYFLMRYNFSALERDDKMIFQLNKRLNFLSRRIDDIIEGISDPFFTLDKNWKFIYLNTAAVKEMDAKKNELIGKDIFKVFPNYRKTIIGQKMLEVKQTQMPLAFEAYDNLFDQWQDLSIYPTSEGITVYIRDAGQRKATENELLKTKRFLEETNEVANIGGWEVDPNKGTVYWSDVTKQIHETEPGFIPDLKSGINFYREGEDRERITKIVSESIENGVGWDTEQQIITAKGNLRWVRTKGKAEFENNFCVRLIGTFQDITEQKRLEFKLKQSEKQFRSAFEYSAIGMALVSPAGKWKMVNASLCQIIGYSQEELFKLSFEDITHPDDLEEDRSLLRELVKGKIPSYQMEKRYFHKDGHVVYILLVVSIVRDEDGNIVHFISQIQDISEKKKAENELKEERLLLRTIIDNLPLNVYLKDLKSNKTLVNKSEMEYMGIKDEADILGKNDYDLYPEESALLSLAEDQEVFRTGKPIIDKETINIKKDGTETCFLTSKIPFTNTQNEIIGLLGISYDITVRNQIKSALQESEQKLSTLFDLSPVGFVLSDYKTGQFLEFNNTFVTNSGYSRDELTQLYYKTIITEEDQDKEVQAKKALAETGHFGSLENQYIRKDGSKYPVLLNGLKIKDANGHVLIWRVVQDISDLKQKEKELVHLNASVEEQNKALASKNEELEQFAYVASHDLQEPLRMITGFLSKIEKKYNAILDDAGKKYIHFAVDGALRMRNLITDILNYSSLNSTGEANLTAVDLDVLVHDIVVSLSLTEKGQHAEINVDKLPVITADKTALHQLFSNLITNAVKYQPAENKPVIKVSVEDKTDQWKFSIADNGIGIDPRFFHKVFNVFQRLHTREEYSGTGIGLAICKKVVNNLKGEIWIDSVPGQGTTFYFTTRK